MNSVLERLDQLAADVRRLDRELAALRAQVLDAPEAAAAEPPPLRIGGPLPAKVAPPRAAESAPVRPPAPPFWSREVVLPRLEAADLLGARGLALAGGVVTLLGVVFFFALAASNGWIGPAERVLLGAAASAIVFVAGVLAHARYGRLYAAVSAAGAGIAGGYATLLFAAARYELVSSPTALVLAAAIASVAVALSLWWSSEIVASFGLIGAMCVPAVALVDDTATTTGTAFVALVLLGAAVVGTAFAWDGLLIAAAIVSVPQFLTLVYQEGEPARGRVLVVAAVFGLLYLGAGCARQLRARQRQLHSVAGSLAGGNVALMLISAFVLLDGDARGVWLAVAAGVYAALAGAAWRREPELAAVGAAAASALTAVALAQFLDGPALVVAWSAETAVLASLGRRLADTRFQILGLAYLGLALVYTLSAEATPGLLFDRFGDHLAGVPALLAVAAGAAAYGLLARTWPPHRDLATMPAPLRELVQGMHGRRLALSAGSLLLAAVLAVDAVSLSLLELVEWLDVEPSFEWGHVAVTGMWSLAAAALLALGLPRRSQPLQFAGLVVLGATILSFTSFTVAELDHVSGWSAVVVAAASAAAALLYGSWGLRWRLVTIAAADAGALLSGFAAFQLLAEDLHGYGLLAAASAYLVVAAFAWRRRDLATWFWAAAVPLAGFGLLLLLDGTWLVVALAAGAVVAAALGRLVLEPRLWIASASLAAVAAGYTFGELAEPGDFVHATSVPAAGVPALILVGAALVGLFFSLVPFAPADQPDRMIERLLTPVRRTLSWSLAGVGLYAASLAILGAAEALSTADQVTEFQRGHTAVSTFWGVTAFVALLVGLRRGVRTVRLAALGLFVLALGKLFVYDLSTLSSVTRALSFLAVGAVLLLAGFFYQRLSVDVSD